MVSKQRIRAYQSENSAMLTKCFEQEGFLNAWHNSRNLCFQSNAETSRTSYSKESEHGSGCRVYTI